MRIRQRKVRFNERGQRGLVERELKVMHREVRFDERWVGGLRESGLRVGLIMIIISLRFSQKNDSK